MNISIQIESIAFYVAVGVWLLYKLYQYIKGHFFKDPNQ